MAKYKLNNELLTIPEIALRKGATVVWVRRMLQLGHTVQEIMNTPILNEAHKKQTA